MRIFLVLSYEYTHRWAIGLYFRVPTSEKDVATFVVVYDRLQQKIVSINKQ